MRKVLSGEVVLVAVAEAGGSFGGFGGEGVEDGGSG